MRNPRFRIAVWLFIVSVFSVSAQTAAEMDALLEAGAVTGAAAARFVLEAAELLPPGLSGTAAENAAWETALANGWVRGAALDTLTLKDLSFLTMKAFGFNGGILYSLFPSPRYAYREMLYNKLIQGRADPDMTVSGQRLLQIIGRTLTHSGENERLADR